MLCQPKKLKIVCYNFACKPQFFTYGFTLCSGLFPEKLAGTDFRIKTEFMEKAEGMKTQLGGQQVQGRAQ